MKNAGLRETYFRDVVAAKKTVSQLEAQLASERSALGAVEARLATVSQQSRESQDKLWALESSAADLEEKVSHAVHPDTLPKYSAFG